MPKKQAASDLFEMKTGHRVLTAWKDVTREEKRRRYGNNVRANDFHRRYSLIISREKYLIVNLRLLIRRYFFMWLKYILLKDSIEKSARSVEFLRTKVSLLLPDYIPGREN